MRRRLVSFFALLLCITYSITCGAISASATYNTLDELPIDPIGDLEQFKEQLPNFSGGLIPTLPEREPELVEPVLGDSSVMDSPVLFSMNNTDKLRTFTVRSGVIEFGNGTGSAGTYTTLSEGDVLSLTSNNGTNAIMVVDNAPARRYTYGYISPGTVVDIESAFQIGEDRVLSISGSGSIGLLASADVIGIPMYPDTVSILVNGSVISTAVSVNDSGVFAFSDGEYKINSAVESVGYRFTFDTAKSGSDMSGSGSTTSYGLLLQFNDQATWEFIESEPEYNGLLNSIIGWLRNMWDAIVSLPGNIANLILDGISALFLPTEEDLLLLQEKYSSLFSERLGFIYQGFEWLYGFLSSFIDVLVAADNYEFTFPGISVPMNGETIVIVEETTVSMDNGVMNVLRPVCGTIVSLIAVIGTVNVLFNMTVALISGASYFEYLKRGRDSDAD